jgi:hypothetical protein
MQPSGQLLNFAAEGRHFGAKRGRVVRQQRPRAWRKLIDGHMDLNPASIVAGGTTLPFATLCHADRSLKGDPPRTGQLIVSDP